MCSLLWTRVFAFSRQLPVDRDWDGAHAFAQGHEDDADACWLHACLHRMEGDAANARYWYGRAERAYETWPDPSAELAAIAAHARSVEATNR